MRDLKVGDLLIRQCDDRAVLVTRVKQVPRAKYGSKLKLRRAYKLLENDRRDQWRLDTEVAVKYRLANP